jgi:hypothetical protein
MDEIQANDVHIAVLNKAFKTTNYQSGGFISWNENEAVQVIKHGGRMSMHLWCCIKMEDPVIGLHRNNIPKNLIVSRSHLEFINMEFINIKNEGGTN